MCALPFCKWRKLIQEVKTPKHTLFIQCSSSYFTKLNSNFKSSYYTRRSSVACPGCMACKEKSQDSVRFILHRSLCSFCLLRQGGSPFDKWEKWEKLGMPALSCHTGSSSGEENKTQVLYKLKSSSPRYSILQNHSYFSKITSFLSEETFSLVQQVARF